MVCSRVFRCFRCLRFLSVFFVRFLLGFLWGFRLRRVFRVQGVGFQGFRV